MATYDQYSANNSMNDSDDAGEQEKISALVANINSKFQQCETTREDDEDRWLQAYHNYRGRYYNCLLYTSPSPRDGLLSRMPSSA